MILDLNFLILIIMLILNIAMISIKQPLLAIVLSLFTFAIGAFYISGLSTLEWNIETLFVVFVMAVAGLSLIVNGSELK